MSLISYKNNIVNLNLNEKLFFFSGLDTKKINTFDINKLKINFN